MIDVHLGEFLNIICPKYSINDDDKNLIEYHTLYKVNLLFKILAFILKKKYSRYRNQNTIHVKFKIQLKQNRFYVVINHLIMLNIHFIFHRIVQYQMQLNLYQETVIISYVRHC